MNITKRYNIVACIGLYTDGSGKKVYRRVGTLCETDTGPVIFMDTTFTPAGCHGNKGGSAILSCYAEDESGYPRRTTPGEDDDIPF